MRVVIEIDDLNGDVEDQEETRYFLHGLYRFVANEHGVPDFYMEVDGKPWPEPGT